MSLSILEASAAVSVTIGVPRHNLAALTEKLASLRCLILLTTRWDASDSVGRESRKLMKRDLARLRSEYSAVIDKFAMTFGVQAAMDAQHDVERRVTVPKGIKPPVSRGEDPSPQVQFEQDEMSGLGDGEDDPGL